MTLIQILESKASLVIENLAKGKMYMPLEMNRLFIELCENGSRDTAMQLYRAAKAWILPMTLDVALGFASDLATVTMLLAMRVSDQAVLKVLRSNVTIGNVDLVEVIMARRGRIVSTRALEELVAKASGLVEQVLSNYLLAREPVEEFEELSSMQFEML